MYGIDLKFLLSVVLNGSYCGCGATSIWTNKHFTIKKEYSTDLAGTQSVQHQLTPFLTTLNSSTIFWQGMKAKSCQLLST